MPRPFAQLADQLDRFGGHVAHAKDCDECQINTADKKDRYFVDDSGAGFVHFLDPSTVAARPRARRLAT